MIEPTYFNGLATVVVHTPTPGYWIGKVCSDPDQATSLGVPVALIINAPGADADGNRYIPLDVLDTAAPEWSGIRHQFEDEGAENPPAITVRATQQDDAMLAFSMAGLPRIPMPIPVLDYMHTVEFTVPHLYALSEDDGFVATMMLDSDSGIYIRYSSQWHQINDEEAVDGLNVTEVNDGALSMFDQYDNAGQLVSLVAMMTPEGAPAGIGGPAEMPVSEGGALAGSVLTLDVPQLLVREDVEQALTAASENPELRWWVSRRLAALGFDDVSLPWAQ